MYSDENRTGESQANEQAMASEKAISVQKRFSNSAAAWVACCSDRM